MNALAPVSIILAIIAWVLMVMMGTNLLSGEAVADRTCDTECIKTYFFSAFGVAIVAFIIGVLSIKNTNTNPLNIIALLASLAICGIVGFLFIAGNLF